MRTTFFVTVMVGMLVFGAIGCDQSKKAIDALMMQNRTLQNKLIDKDVEIARLDERSNALKALLKERDGALETLQDKTQALEESYGELMEAHKKLLGGLAARPAGGGSLLPGPVSIAIEKIADAYPNLFTFNRAKGELRFSSDVTFDLGSFAVKAGASQALGELAKVLTTDAGSGILVSVVGHTDNVPVRKKATIDSLKAVGLSADNMGLSVARARAVAGILQQNGVAKSRVITSGKGDKQPVTSNKTRASRAQNRRVEIFLRVGPAR